MAGGVWAWLVSLLPKLHSQETILLVLLLWLMNVACTLGQMVSCVEKAAVRVWMGGMMVMVELSVQYLLEAIRKRGFGEVPLNMNTGVGDMLAWVLSKSHCQAVAALQLSNAKRVSCVQPMWMLS